MSRLHIVGAFFVLAAAPLPMSSSFARAYDPVTETLGAPTQQLTDETHANFRFALDADELGFVVTTAFLDWEDDASQPLLALLHQLLPYLVPPDPNASLADLGLDPGIALEDELGMSMLADPAELAAHLAPIVSAAIPLDTLGDYGVIQPTGSPTTTFDLEPQAGWSSLPTTDYRAALANASWSKSPSFVPVVDLTSLILSTMLRQAERFHAANGTTPSAAELSALVTLAPHCSMGVETVAMYCFGWFWLLPPAQLEPPPVRVRISRHARIRRRSLLE